MIVRFGSDIRPDINDLVISLHQNLIKNPFDGYIESVPSYCALTIFYDPLQIEPEKPFQSRQEKAASMLKTLLADMDTIPLKSDTAVRIPVCYGGHFGPDLKLLSEWSGLSEKEIITRHIKTVYRVYMIGFTPGFPYMGTVDASIAMPRKETPRLKVHAGSVGIAGSQTGIYPVESPGGWQIIGRTPLQLFNAHAEPPCLLSPGQSCVFYPVRPDQFDAYTREPE